jgi:hypothetical protein
MACARGTRERRVLALRVVVGGCGGGGGGGEGGGLHQPPSNAHHHSPRCLADRAIVDALKKKDERPRYSTYLKYERELARGVAVCG